MTSGPDDIEVEGFLWDFGPDGNVQHLNRHDVSVEDVDAVLAFGPLFYRSTGGGRATHAMVGRDAKARSLIVYILATTQPGIWEPVTGWQSRLAHQLLAKENRI